MSNGIKKFEKDYSKEPDLSMEEFKNYARSIGVDVPGEEPKKVTIQTVPETMQGSMSSAEQAEQGKGVLSQVGQGVGKGIIDNAQNIVNGAITVFDAMENFASSKLGVGSGDLVSDDSKVQWAEKLGSPDDSIITRTSRMVTKNAIPIVATMGYGVGIKAALSAGAVVDFLALDPKQERLSDLILKEAPEAKNIAVIGNALDFMSNKEGDSDLEGRFKNALENLGFGAGIAGLIRGAQRVSNGYTKYAKGVAETEKAALSAEMKVVKEAPAVMDEVALAAKEAEMSAESAKLDDGVRQIFGDNVTVATKVGEEVVPNIQNANVADYVNNFYKEFPQTNLERAPKSFTELSAEAQAIVQNPEELLKWRQGTRPLTDSEVKATQYMLHSISEDMVESAQKYMSNQTPEGLAAFGEKLNAFKLMNNLDKGAGSASGASLQAHKLLASMDMSVDDFMKAQTAEGKQRFIQDMLKNSGEKDLNDIAKTLSAMKDITDVNKAQALLDMSRQTTLRKGKEILEFTALNGMLSSPKTPIGNFIANALVTTKSVVDNYVGVGVGAITNSADKLTLETANASVRSGFFSMGEAFKNSWRALRGEGTTIEKALKPEFQRVNPISSVALGVEDGILASTIDGVGMVVGAPVKINATADAWFGTVNYRSKIMEMAVDEATRTSKLIESGAMVPDAVKGLDQKQLVDYYLNNNTMRMHEGAMAHAQELSFSKALPPASLAEKAGELLDNAPLGRVVFPFFKTNYNIIDYGFRNSPFALLSTKIRSEIAAGGKAADMAIAKITTGSTFLGVAAWLAADGMVTGPEPTNWKVAKALEEAGQGWKPNSLKIGDNYYSMQRLDPMSSFLRLGSVIAASRNYLDDQQYGALASVAAGAVVDFMTPEMMVDGMGRFFEAWTEAAKYTNSDSSKVDAVLVDYASRFVPFGSLQRDIRNEVDPYKAAAVGLDGFTDKLIRRLKNTVPGFSESLPIERNMFGEALTVPAGVGPDMLSPIAESTGSNSVLVQRLKALAQYKEELGPSNDLLDAPIIANMPKTFTEKGVSLELTPAEYERFQMYRGGIDPVSNTPFMKTLRESMEEVTDKVWAEVEGGQMSPRTYNKLVGELSKVVNKYNKVANSQMLQEPEFLEKWMKATEEINKDSNLLKLDGTLGY